MTATQATAAPPFAQLYPLAAFEAIADAAWWRSNDFGHGQDVDQDARIAAGEADAADKTRLDKDRAVFAAATDAHLVNLRAAGRLSPITGLAGREIPEANAWNGMVAGTPDKWHHRWLLDSFRSVWTDEFVRMDDGRHDRRRDGSQAPGTHRAPSRENMVKAWTAICSRMDQGNSREYEFGLGTECTDQKTGDRCEIHFSGWKPTLMVRNAQHRLEPARDVEEAPLVEADFDVPTGALLMTDYLRVEGFSEGVEFGPKREYRELDLNSAKGRDARIAAHAAEHGIGYVQTTNTSVAVHRHSRTGTLMVTQRWWNDPEGDEMPEDELGIAIVKGWKGIAAFSCDMWRVMAMDRSTAITRMKAGGNANADKTLADYLASNDAYAGNVAGITVKPGRWRIHGGDDFSRRVDRKRFGIPPRVHVWCLLERVGEAAA